MRSSNKALVTSHLTEIISPGNAHDSLRRLVLRPPRWGTGISVSTPCGATANPPRIAAQGRGACWAVALVAVALSSCGGGGGGGGNDSSQDHPSVEAVTISSFLAQGNVALAGGSLDVAATLANDSANAGVSWSVSCVSSTCGTVSPSSSTSGVYVTYSAPAALPAADLAVTLTATAVSSPSVKADFMLTVPALEITVSGSTSHYVHAGSSSPLTATANYPDAVAAGFMWSAQCSATDCGTVSPLASANGAVVTYTAPAAAPPADLMVTVTATDTSAGSVYGSVDLVVRAISVGVTPTSALIPLTRGTAFSGSIDNDPSSGELDWSLQHGRTACDTECGAISATTTQSGGTVTYTAPSVLPGDPTVFVTAALVTDSTKTAVAQVSITDGTVMLVPADVAFIKVSHRYIPPPEVVTLTNTGMSPLAIDRVTIEGSGASGFSQTNDCGTQVDSNASCQIIVRYMLSTGTAAVLAIYDSSPDSPQRVPLSKSPASQSTAAIGQSLSKTAALATPAPSGEARVGTRTLFLTDSSRTDPFVADPRPRELAVRLWYPTAGDGACASAAYAPPQVWQYFAKLVGVTPPQVSTHSCLDAPIASGGARPVILITHGFTGTSSDYTFIGEDLASRGYVVAALDHTHEATAVETPDGRLETSIFGSHLTHYTRTDAGAIGIAVSVRLQDIRFVLNQLQRMASAPAGPFAGRLDLSRIAIIGHSLGGLTVLRALQSESRIRAGVLLDGLLPPFFEKPINQPVLAVMADRVRWNEDDCRLWQALKGPRLAIGLPGAGHMALSDAVWLLKDQVATDSTTSEAIIGLTRENVAMFLDAALQAEAVARIAGMTVTRYPGVLVSSQSPPACEVPGGVGFH